MKKKLLALTLCLGMVATALVGCGDKSSEKETETTAKKEDSIKFTIERDGYVGIEVEESYATVSEEELQSYIESDLEANKTTETITEGVLEAGMVVDIDYTGTVDGSEYTSMTGSQITLDSSSFAIDGFTDGLVGKSVGEEFEMTLYFPDDFEDEAYASKEIIFTGKINGIVNTIIPELNDEYVKEVYSYLGISTVDEYKAEYERNIKVQKIYSVVWPILLENMNVEKYNEEELESVATSISENIEYNIVSYGSDLATYLELVGMTQEEFDEECLNEAKSQLKNEAIIAYIAEKEGITVTDEEYAEELSKTMVAYGMETEEEFYEYFSTYYGYDEAYFRESFLMNKVVEFVCDNIVVVPDVEETTAAETETTAGESETTSAAE